jgi:hypothetical protein
MTVDLHDFSKFGSVCGIFTQVADDVKIQVAWLGCAVILAAISAGNARGQYPALLTPTD